MYISQQQIGRRHIYIEYPKSAQSTAAFVCRNSRWSLRSVVIIVCPCVTPLGTSRRGTLCHIYLVFFCFFFIREIGRSSTTEPFERKSVTILLSAVLSYCCSVRVAHPLVPRSRRKTAVTHRRSTAVDIVWHLSIERSKERSINDPHLHVYSYCTRVCKDQLLALNFPGRR